MLRSGGARPGHLAPLVVFVLALALYLPGAWRVPFASDAEPVEALVVREMVRTGDWILPLRNGNEIPSKPPFFHWLALPFVHLAGGVSETGVRLPSVLCAALTVALVFAAGSAEWGTLAGGIAALALATSPEWARWAVLARTDATFVACATAAFLLGAAWLRADPARSPQRGGCNQPSFDAASVVESSRDTAKSSPASPDWLLVLAAASSACAVLAKGPAGLVLPGLVIAIEIARRGAWRRLRSGPLALAALIFVVVAGSWYAAALAREGGAFFAKQILAENVFRFLPNEEGWPSREHGVFFYAPQILAGMAPWSLVLPAAFLGAWRGWGKRENDLAEYCVIWFAVVFVLCTLASGKRSNYVLPLYPAAALLIGRTLAGSLVFEVPRLARFVAGFVAAVLALVAAVSAAWAMGLEPWTPVLPLLHPRDQQNVPAIAAEIGRPSFFLPAAFGILALALFAGLYQRAWRAVAGLVAAGLLTLVTTSYVFLRPVEARLKTARPFAEELRARIPPGEAIVFYPRARYDFLFYFDRHVPIERRWGAITAPAWVLITESNWLLLPAPERERGRVVSASRETALVRPEARLLLVRLEGDQTDSSR